MYTHTKTKEENIIMKKIIHSKAEMESDTYAIRRGVLCPDE
jgi:hypothetical protein